MTHIRLSIKHFIADWPRIFNENFEKVFGFINHVYDDERDVMKVKKLECEGTVTANTVTTNNLIVKGPNGKTINVSELVAKIQELEETVSALKEENDALKNNEELS